MLALAHGRDAEALAAFEAAEPLAGLLAPEHPAAVLVQAHILQVLTRLGKIGRVDRALAELTEQPERGEMRVVVAALRLAKDDPRAAITALAPVLDGSDPVTNCGWAIQAFLLDAIARDALGAHGDQAAAGRALEHALELAARDGAVLAFALNPAPELLRRHVWHCAGHTALISEILRLPGPGRPGGPEGLARSAGMALPEDPGRLEAASPRLVEPLTDSETRILRYLPTNLSAPEIADQLSVSANTVRTHMRHVYEKLGAHRRADAVDRARALGLLAPPPPGV
jgi:LuxR family maltose regulon positive regulatory protein